MLMVDDPRPPLKGTGGNCNFDSSAFVRLFPNVENTSGIGKLYLQLTPDATAYITGLYTETHIEQIFQPSPVRGAFFTASTRFTSPATPAALLIYPENPNYPTAWLNSHGLSGMVGQPLAVSNRLFASGLRTEQDTNTQQNWVAGVKGTWLKDWDYDINVQWSQSESKGKLTSGYFSLFDLANAWNTVGNTPGSYVDPWAPDGVQNPKLAEAIKAANYVGQLTTATETLKTFNAHTVGDIYTLPAGPVAMNIGTSYMKQEYNLDVPDILQTGDISGLGGSFQSQSGERNVTSAYVEFDIPITKEFHTNVSGRVDHYSDLVDEETPVTGKVSVTWQPWQWGMFRGSLGNGFRAPTLGELHSPLKTGSTEQFIDPLRPSLGPIQPNSLIGGNPDLVPETSNQWAVGFVWTPMKNLSAHIDWWNIKIKNYIGTPSALALTNQCRAAPCPPSVLFQGELVPIVEFADPADVTSEVAQVVQQNANQGTAQFEGLDLGASWRQPSDYGTWGIDYNGTYYIKANLTQGSATEKNVGTLVDPATLVPLLIPLSSGGVILRYKHILSLNWNYGPWGATLVNNYWSGYQDAPNQVITNADGSQTPHFVPYFMTWDLQGTWSASKNVQFTVGARNLFDKDPHLYISTLGQFQAGYDASIYDPRARVFYARAVVTFN